MGNIFSELGKNTGSGGCIGGGYVSSKLFLSSKIVDNYNPEIYNIKIILYSFFTKTFPEISNNDIMKWINHVLPYVLTKELALYPSHIIDIDRQKEAEILAYVREFCLDDFLKC